MENADKDINDLTTRNKLLMKQGCNHQQYQSVIKYYKMCLDNNPMAHLLWYELGLVYAKLQLYNQALEAFDFSIAINSKFTYVWVEKANILSIKGKISEAINCYHNALKLEPNIISVWEKLANMYFQNEDINYAIYYYSKVIQFDSNNSKAYLGRASCYKILEEYERVEKDMEKAFEYSMIDD